jgi:uncharacterized protein YecE (DUF72 family)
MGWSYAFWVGNFYPPGLGQEGFLQEYARHFSTVEVDSTYYRIPYESTVKSWDESTPSGFVFAAKFPKRIAHEKRFRGAADEARVFVGRMGELGDKLGPLLLQLPLDFRKEELPTLMEFIDALPKGHRYVVEAKGKSSPVEELIPMLKEREIAMATVDSPQAPLIEALTSDFFYVRLEGDKVRVKGVTGRVEVNREGDLSRWASKLKQMATRAGDVYVYCSKYYSGHSPTDALELKQLLAIA